MPTQPGVDIQPCSIPGGLLQVKPGALLSQGIGQPWLCGNAVPSEMLEMGRHWTRAPRCSQLSVAPLWWLWEENPAGSSLCSTRPARKSLGELSVASSSSVLKAGPVFLLFVAQVPLGAASWRISLLRQLLFPRRGQQEHLWWGHQQEQLPKEARPIRLRVHGIMEWYGSGETLKLIQFQPLALGRDTFH